MARLFVCCGHGAGDSGAVGNGITEADYVRRLGAKLKEYGGGDVVLLDTSRNWYEDTKRGSGFATLNTQGAQVVELHADAFNGHARGGHILIKAGFDPDQYDRRLAEFIGREMAGRSELIQRVDWLCNANTCAARNIAYRLLEVGFIDNNNDRRAMLDKMDTIARGILAVFDIRPAAPAPKAARVCVWSLHDGANQAWQPVWHGEEFELINRATGLALDVNGADPKKGATVQGWERNGSPAQRWRLEPARVNYKPVGVNPYVLVPVCAPSCVLDVYGAKTEQGARVQTWERIESPAQLWCIIDTGDGFWRIVNPHALKALDLAKA